MTQDVSVPVVVRPSGSELSDQLDQTQARLKGGNSSKSDEEATVPIPRHMMDGLGEEMDFGSLRLYVKAQPIRHQKRVQQAMWSAWPALLTITITSDRRGRGIDLSKVTERYQVILKSSNDIAYAEAMEAYEKALLENTKATKPKLGDVSLVDIGDVDIELRAFNDILADQAQWTRGNDDGWIDGDGVPVPTVETEEPHESGEGKVRVRKPVVRLVDRIAESVWPTVCDTQGIENWQELAVKIENTQTISGIVDICRACLNAYGPQPGSMFDRFQTR